MKAHIVENGVVVNTIMVDSLDFLPNLIDASNGGTIGDSWDGESFSSPPVIVTVPETITPRQGRIILSRYGMLATVDAYMNALEGQPGEEARIDWTMAQEWRRDWPLLVAAAAAFGLSSAQIDQMFIEASAL